MLIIGAGGFASELLEIIDSQLLDNLAFYDDLNMEVKNIFEKYPVLKNEGEAQSYFKNYDNKFILGMGSPILRFNMSVKFKNLGGVLSSCFSSFSRIGKYNVNIGVGTNILDNAIVSNNVQIGIGCIIYYNSIITHDCVINDFVEISPGATILGRSCIGHYSHIGSNATVLPNLIVGKNVIVGAGAVVTKNVPDNCIVTGIPAVIKKFIPPIVE